MLNKQSCVCVYYLSIGIHAHTDKHVYVGVFRDQKRALNPLELEAAVQLSAAQHRLWDPKLKLS